MRVLLADDHVMFREGMRPFLLQLAPEVQVVETGSFTEAFAKIEAGERFDLILLDMKMPGMNGGASVRSVRGHCPDTPLVILSGVVEREVMVEAINAGAGGYVPKKLSSAAMVSALKLVMAGERFLPVSMLAETSDNGTVFHTAPASGKAGRLTKREHEILALLKDGLPNKLIAAQLTLSEVTVKSHLCSIFRKLGVSNRVQAIRSYTNGEMV